MKVEFNNYWEKGFSFFELINIRYDWDSGYFDSTKYVEIVLFNFGVDILWGTKNE